MDRIVNGPIERDNDAVIALLRRTFDADVADIDAGAMRPHSSTSLRTTPTTAPRRRARQPLWLAAAAAAVLAVGVAGLLRLGRDGNDAPSSSTSLPITTVAGPAQAVSWFVPRTVPAGYELIDLVATENPPDPVADIDGYVIVGAGLMPIDGSSGMIWISSSPAFPTGSETVESVGAETEQRVVDGREYRIVIGEALGEGDDPHTTVTWVDVDRSYSMIARTNVDTAMAVATGVEPITEAEATAVAGEIDGVAATLPTVSSAEFSDGTVVTTHTSRDRDAGVAALCVRAAALDCVRTSSEGALGGERGADQMFEAFDVDGERRVIGWTPNDPAAIEIVPAMLVGVESDPAALDTIEPEIVPATTGGGYFVTFVVPEGEPVPGIALNDGSGVTVLPTETIRP